MSQFYTSLENLNRGILIYDIIRHAYDGFFTNGDELIRPMNRLNVSEVQILVNAYKKMNQPQQYWHDSKRKTRPTLYHSWLSALKQAPKGGRDFWAKLLNVCYSGHQCNGILHQLNGLWIIANRAYLKVTGNEKLRTVLIVTHYWPK
jgi:hypothetical protein